MNTKLLKQKILDLAIRGKLTQQLKSDGTAADLLKEISSASHPERSAKGAKSKDLKQIIPLGKNEAPFEIPANWEWVRLPDVCSIPITDGTHQTPTYSNKEDGIPFLSAKDVTTQKIVWDKIKYITKSLHEELCLRIAPKRNDILLAKNGTTGVAALVETDIVFDIYVTLAVLRPRKIVNPRFLLYFVNGPVAKAQFDASLKGVGVPNLHLSEINKVVLPLPPLAEQQRIVAKIEEAFAEIDAIEKNKELLKTHIKQTRQKILDLAIHGKLVPQNKSDEPASILLERITRDNPHYEKMGLDERRETKDERDSNYKRHSREGGNLPPMLSKDEVPFEVPENWCWCRLGDICNKLIDGDHNPPKGLDYVTKYMMLSSRNINDNDIVDLENVRYLSKEMFEEENQRTKLEEGDILFTSVGSLGRSCIFSGDGKYCFQRSVSLIHTNIYNEYLKYFFDSNYYQKYIVENATGTAQMGFYLEQMRKSFIAIPPLAEQSRIVTKIEELFSALDQMERNLV